MEFIKEGGWPMLSMLFCGLVTVVFAAMRPTQDRAAVLLGGSVVALINGVLGMATGLKAVSAGYERFPDKLPALAIGLGELANNGILAAVLASVLLAAAWVARSNAQHS